jgi:alpha-beta hydrolase superfamily lysophospholipase
LGYYLHWSYDTLLSMEHVERQQWISHTSAINRKVNEDQKPGGGSKSILSIT